MVSVGSGLDVASVVNQLMQVERAPATRYNSLRLAALARATAWSDIGSKVSAARTAAEALATPQKSGPAKATSSDASIVTATATDGARAASLRLTVNRLAVAEQRSSVPLAGPTTLAGAGTALLSSGLATTGISSLAADDSATAGKRTLVVTQASTAATRTGSAAPQLTSTLGVGPRSVTVSTEATTASVDLATSYATTDEMAADLRTKLAGVVDVSVQNGGIRFTSISEGSATRIDVSGSGAAALGMDTSTTVAGSDGLVSLDGVQKAVTLVKAGTTVDLGAGISLTAGGGLRAGTATTQLVRTTPTSTLADLANALNAGGPTSASLVNTGDGSAAPYRLVLSAAATGTAGRLTVSSTGIAALESTTVTTASADAELTVGGLSVIRSSNTVSNLLPEVTLRLLKTGEAQVEVARDETALATRTKALVDGLNGLFASVSTQAKPGLDGTKAGPLAGHSAARGLTQQFQALSAQATGSATTRVLSQVGITVTRTGQFALDEAALARAVQQDPDGVSTLLSSFATLVAKTAKAVTDPDGIVSTTGAAANRQAQARQKQIDDLDQRLVIVERRYRAQFAKLDAAMSVLNSQSGRLASQIAGLGA